MIREQIVNGRNDGGSKKKVDVVEETRSSNIRRKMKTNKFSGKFERRTFASFHFGGGIV